jgi:hypothetical protein
MAAEDFTVVVSGLPRSGTSVMMQMLAAGGIPVATDECRPPDADNPCGYFELEAVKSIARDASFLDGCRGKVVKIIHALLPHLKLDREYRIIFMRRKLDEVLASQRKMLDRAGRGGATLNESQLKPIYANQIQQALRWLGEHRDHIRVLEIDYAELIIAPTLVANAVNAFFDGMLDETAMAAVVNPSLRRNRS